MVEHLLFAVAVDIILAIDRFFQRRLRSAVPDHDELWNESETLLERQDVVIGPMRCYAQAVVLGLLCGFALSCGWVFYRIDKPMVGDAARIDRVLLLGAVFVVPLLGIGFFWHWLRGGVMVLRRHGVVLRYRNQRVYCDWSVFHTSLAANQKKGNRWYMPINTSAVYGVIQSRLNSVIACGREVRTYPLYFRSDGHMVMRDVYAVRFADLAALLLHLGRRLGTKTPARMLEAGDPVDEAMT